MFASLEGLSVGDALGHRFNTRTAAIASALMRRLSPPPPWTWTDDTLMALSVAEVVARDGEIEPSRLADSFLARYEQGRGYGPKMKQLLRADAADGASVCAAATRLFDGGGSFGNGAAMRVAPLGAFFVGDVPRAAKEAAQSAIATHTHQEAIAGASAVAVAACHFASSRDQTFCAEDAFRIAAAHTPASDTREAIWRASTISFATRPIEVAKRFRADRDIACQASVPFCLWLAFRHADDYPRALWETYAAGGDRDTHAAIVGGIVALRVGVDGIPEEWRHTRESLPSWFYEAVAESVELATLEKTARDVEPELVRSPKRFQLAPGNGTLILDTKYSGAMLIEDEWLNALCVAWLKANGAAVEQA